MTREIRPDWDRSAPGLRAAWDAGDHARHYPYIETPKARYAFFQVDRVIRGESAVGLPLDAGYIANEHAFVSLATVDQAVAQPGTEVVLLRGEEPNSAKPAVERHRQAEIRAMVAPCAVRPRSPRLLPHIMTGPGPPPRRAARSHRMTCPPAPKSSANGIIPA